MYLYSIISGFRAILGSIAIQLAMGIVTIFIVNAPDTPYLVEPFEGANAELHAKLEYLLLMISVTHVICFAAQFTEQYINERWFELMQVGVCLSMVAQVCNVTLICQFLILEKQFEVDMAPNYDEFRFWLEVEVLVFAAGIASNVIYLFVRSFVQQKITLRVTQMKQDVNTDYLESQSFMLCIFLTFVVPACVLFYIEQMSD